MENDRYGYANSMALAKVVIIGSNGFIGSNLRVTLSQHEVIAIANKQELESYKRKIERINAPTVFVWAASKVNPVISSDSPHLMEREYKDFSDFVTFLNERKSNSFDRLVILSSGGCVYTENAESYSENSTAGGANDYGQLKLRLEKRALDFSGENIICRIANVYGPGQKPGQGQGVISNWLHGSARNEPIKLFGDGTEFRDFIFISDAASAISQLIAHEASGIYNIGSGIPTSLNRIIELIGESLSTKIEVVKLPRRHFDRIGYFLNIDKIRADTSWTPKISIEEGVKLTRKYLKGIN